MPEQGKPVEKKLRVGSDRPEVDLHEVIAVRVVQSRREKIELFTVAVIVGVVVAVVSGVILASIV
jgi:hypothetical protein